MQTGLMSVGFFFTVAYIYIKHHFSTYHHGTNRQGHTVTCIVWILRLLESTCTNTHN